MKEDKEELIEIDYDFIVPFQAKKTFKVKAKVKSVTKHIPKVTID
jgi:hypothetical protein